MVGARRGTARRAPAGDGAHLKMLRVVLSIINMPGGTALNGTSGVKVTVNGYVVSCAKPIYRAAEGEYRRVHVENR